ncbi:MAG TPA: radical SAM protein [Solirubrobacterales bacterium]|nr:radical SAM protein [Solirubrobacterales bacterium]
MRVLFYYRGVESLGVGYLMSMLKQHGHEVDLVFDPGIDDNLFLKAPWLHWLNRHEALIERAKAFKPDLIAVSILTNIYPFVKQWCRRFKQEIGVPIIAGNSHVQALPDYVLANPDIDMVCTGEGEVALLELCNRMERGEDHRTVPGIWVKDADGTIHRNEMGELVNDLDLFPFPEKDLWFEYGCFHDNLEIFTGRGCPFRCTFCNIHYQRSIFKDKGDFLRKRSIANVMEEFKVNLSKFDPRMVSVHDDNFTTDRPWVEEFCEAYRKEVNLPWYCFGYPTTINAKLVKAMKAANCMTIFMGVDSGDPALRRHIMERPMTDELIFKSARLIKDGGIGLQVSCIYGMPTETPEQMWKTLAMVDEINPTQCSAYIFYPFPKTKLHDFAVQCGQLTEEGQQKVREGISGYHHETLLAHPHKDLAETLAKMTPIYARAPKSVRPLLRRLIGHRVRWLAQFLYVVLIPITFPFLGLEGIKITLKMAWRALTRRPFRPRGRRAVVGTPPPGGPPPELEHAA